MPIAPLKASQLKCIYRILYKNAKKSAKRTTDFDITNSERIYRKKDILQLSAGYTNKKSRAVADPVPKQNNEHTNEFDLPYRILQGF